MLSGSEVCLNSYSSPEHALDLIRSPTFSADVTAFASVNVLPMDGERVLLDQTVLIEGGHITAIGAATHVQVPPRALRIDGRGQYLVPGLADMHFHYGAVTEASILGLRDRLFQDLANGVTAVRFLTEVDASKKQLLDHLKTAEIPTPHIFLAPAIHSGPGRVASAVAAAKVAGYEHIMASIPFKSRSFSSYTKDAGSPPEHLVSSYDSLLLAARRAHFPLSTHDHSAAFDGALSLGAYGGSVEHLHIFWDTLGFHRLQNRDPADVSRAELQAVVGAARRADLWITPTLRCLEHVKPTHVTIMRKIVKALDDAGVGLLLGADAGDGWDVHSELAALVRAGLSPFQALLTGTRNVAQYMGMLDERGTVAVGKRADLVLLSGNPLEDIRYTRELAGVMVNGRWFDQATLAQHLLASPESWFKVEMLGRLKLHLSNEEYRRLGTLIRRFLELAKTSSDRNGRFSDQHRFQLLANELGAMYALLTPNQRKIFTSAVRPWLREQGRKGYRIVIPGLG